MPLPKVVTRFNKRYLNPLLGRLVGKGPMARLEHRGRKSGLLYRTTILAFRHGQTITLALTYGRDVDWLKNVEAASGCSLILGKKRLRLGPPRDLTTKQGLKRMPNFASVILPLTGTSEFIELPILSEELA